LQKLKIYKFKQREGGLERYVDGYSAVGKGLFKKETDISQFVGLRVRTEAGEEGTIQSSFGKSGKFKVGVRYKETLTLGSSNFRVWKIVLTFTNLGNGSQQQRQTFCNFVGVSVRPKACDNGTSQTSFDKSGNFKASVHQANLCQFWRLQLSILGASVPWENELSETRAKPLYCLRLR
jgi:hypothetical protein